MRGPFSRQLLIVTILVAFLSGCAFVVRFPAFKSPGKRPGLYRGAWHVHSEFSHDSLASLERIINTAKRAGLDFVVVTDHNTLAGRAAYEKMDAPERPLLIFGNEISTDAGHVIALGVRDEIPGLYKAQQVIDWIGQNGGHAIIAHPTSPKKPWTQPHLKGIEGLEIFSFPDVYYSKEMMELGPKATILPPGPFINSVIETPTQALQLWDDKLLKQQTSAFGSVDAHLRWEWKGMAPENYLLYFQAVTTYVIARSFNEKEIVQSLVDGKSFVAHETRGVAQDFSFVAKSGGNQFGPGSLVAFEPNISLIASLPEYGEIQLLKDGEVIQRVNGNRLEAKVQGAGTYRLEVYRAGKLWIAANPIYVR